ncbi:hypothetical protein GCM10011403_25430 [Pseudohongiella nitratireducens]|jgi:hypothetical protein|uniref:Uncharacterized protein n=1 Tax=Pseudohongiella nitratireducens TaxID=1768907 RepID=A0A916QMY5_9GAMM|nr:hypothetical protein [Pseudohongiella nitratireducens]MDF1624073.1 hypothetical protein [Pseudohongiella nitratireducens]GFZ81181.1 hypothetical protein GCM10011403_25430 [Pseudohongiella nitratireducens]|tara:strand:+ start:3418 stop:3807 length:390 start_codon:yes stop_codon:yes gene_type:complete
MDHQGDDLHNTAEVTEMLKQHAADEPSFPGLQQRLNAIPDTYPRQSVSTLVTQLLATLWPEQLSANWRLSRLAFLALLPMALGVSIGQVLPSGTEEMTMTAETEWYYLAFGDVSSDIAAGELNEMEAAP